MCMCSEILWISIQYLNGKKYFHMCKLWQHYFKCNKTGIERQVVHDFTDI